MRGRKVALIIDNCPAHPLIENLKSISLYFLQPITISTLQPLDHGVICSLKAKYRTLSIQKIITTVDQENFHTRRSMEGEAADNEEYIAEEVQRNPSHLFIFYRKRGSRSNGYEVFPVIVSKLSRSLKQVVITDFFKKQ